MKQKEEKHDGEETLSIEYKKEKGRKVLLCKKTGVKTWYHPKSNMWKVGYRRRTWVDVPWCGGSIHISGRGFYLDKNWRNCKEVMLWTEVVLDLLPLLDVAVRVAKWLKDDPQGVQVAHNASARYWRDFHRRQMIPSVKS